MLAEIWPFVRACRAAGQPVVLARVIARTGSGGRRLGAAMAVSAFGEWAGSVAGGCVDGDVLAAAAEVHGGMPPALMLCDLGPEGRPPWEDGPACNGKVTVLISPLFNDKVCTAVDLTLDASPTEGQPPPPLLLTTRLIAPYDTWLEAGEANTGVFVEPIRPAPRLVIVGATDIAKPLSSFAAAAGFRVVVLEPRPVYGQPDRVPDATLVRAWPSAWLGSHRLGGDDALIALTHEPRLDDAALVQALLSGCGYIAAIGSRETHAERLVRLAHIPGSNAIHGPAGLDLGGNSAAQTAISMLAEVVAVRNGRPGGALVHANGPVHAA